MAIDLSIRNEARRPSSTLEDAVADIEAGVAPALALDRLSGRAFVAATLAYELRGLDGLRELLEEA